MAVWYLDNEDEITDAVARLRGTTDEQVVFVVPPGSRIATGRINFRLLAREAQSRALIMAIASPDEQVRAMAASAGVLACVTPDEAEAALERGDQPEPGTATQPAAPPRTTLPATAAAAAGDGPRGGRLRLAVIAVLALVITGVLVGLQVLPTAEITLVPRVATLGPLEMQVSASTDTDTADPARGVIPAEAVAIPLSAQDTYPASGVRTAQTQARGEVVFSSAEQEFNQEIAAGTRVQTPAGISFQTTETVTLARTQGGEPTSIAAPIEALEPGEAGNVPAGAISLVPSLERQGISVDNPEATGGGRVVESPLVTAADFDAAVIDLRNRLTGDLAAYLRDPANTPAGLTVFPETALLGPVGLEPAADGVVGRSVPDFELAGSVVAQVLAVDEDLVDEVVRVRLDQALPAGMRFIPGSVAVEHGQGSAEGDQIVFPSSAQARTTPLIDPAALVAQVAGLPVSDAQAILERLGKATVNVWPGFLGDLPNDRERITLDVDEASATE